MSRIRLVQLPDRLVGKDADTVDGLHGSDLSASSHTHDAFAGLSLTSDLLIAQDKFIGITASGPRFYFRSSEIAFAQAISVPANIPIHLEGYGGDTYIRYNSAGTIIEAVLNGTRRAYLDATGWHAG